jgi:hypothetical protein
MCYLHEEYTKEEARAEMKLYYDGWHYCIRFGLWGIELEV